MSDFTKRTTESRFKTEAKRILQKDLLIGDEDGFDTALSAILQLHKEEIREAKINELKKHTVKRRSWKEDSERTEQIKGWNELRESQRLALYGHQDKENTK